MVKPAIALLFLVFEKILKLQTYQLLIPRVSFLCLTIVSLLLVLSGCSTSQKTQSEWAKLETVDYFSQPVPIIASSNISINKVSLKDKDKERQTYRASKKRSNDLLHTQLKVAFNWNKAELIGQAHLTLKPFYYPTNKVVLDAKGFEIKQVALIKQQDTIALPYRYLNKMQLHIQLDTIYTRKQPYELYIDYIAKPEELVAENDYFTSENKGLYFINRQGTTKNKPTQIWTQGETESSSCWFPTIDSPNERATQELWITVAEKYTSISNGLLVNSTINKDGTRTDYWKQTHPHAPYLTALAISEFAVVEDKWRDIAVNYYVEPEYKAYAKDIFGQTPEMMEFFSNLLDYDFPWEKYSQAVVRDFVASAMENTSIVLFDESMHLTKQELISGDHEDIIAHELIHHWFGNLVTCESWSNLALNEAFANYGEYLWFEHKYGKKPADYHLHKNLRYYLAEAESKQLPIIRFYYEDREDMFDRHSYQKGGRALHMLRNYLGDEAFFASIRLYLKQQAYKAVEVHDLRLAFEEVTGEDLNWFFNQWFLNEGHPILEINYDYDDNKKQAIVRIEQLQVAEGIPLFKLPIDIDVYHTDGSVKRERVVLNQVENTFYFDAAHEPQLINVDADKVLLGEKIDNKSMEGYLYQYYHAPSYMDKLEAIVAFEIHQQNNLNATNGLLAAMQDDFWAIRKQAVEAFRVTGEQANKNLVHNLIQLAQEDTAPQVRAAALERLSEYNDEKLVILFAKAINDPSYMVVATALLNLYDMAPDVALDGAGSVEHTNNSTISNLVARIYAEKGGAEKQQYFEEKLDTAETVERYSLIEYYGDFLNRSGDVAVDRGLPILSRIATEDRNWWIRLNATEAITDIKNIYTIQRNSLSKQVPNGTNMPINKNEAINFDKYRHPEINPIIEQEGQLNKEAMEEIKLKKEMSVSTNVLTNIQALNSRISRIEQILQQIKAQETNKKVLEYYQDL